MLEVPLGVPLTGQLSWRAAGRLPRSVDAYYLHRNDVRSAGLVPISRDRLYLWMLEPYRGEWIPPGEQLARLRERLAGFGPKVAATVGLLDGELDCRPLQALLVPPPWHVGRIVLVGDAAHTTTPQIAYGVGIAIEDAVVLADLVASGLEGDALGTAYTARRYERGRLVVETSVQLGKWEIDPPEDRMARSSSPTARWPHSKTAAPVLAVSVERQSPRYLRTSAAAMAGASSARIAGTR